MEEEPQQQSLAAEGEEEPRMETNPTEEHEEGGGGEEDEEEAENEGLIIKAQALMEKITASPDNPNPNTIHALSSLFEIQEARDNHKILPLSELSPLSPTEPSFLRVEGQICFPDNIFNSCNLYIHIKMELEEMNVLLPLSLPY